MDASSKYQNSLPVSSDHLLRQLDEWKITYKCYKHVPLKTVEESKKVQSKLLNFNEGGGHIKNLYLRDNKKRNFSIASIWIKGGSDMDSAGKKRYKQDPLFITYKRM